MSNFLIDRVCNGQTTKRRESLRFNRWKENNLPRDLDYKRDMSLACVPGDDLLSPLEIKSIAICFFFFCVVESSIGEMFK